MTRSFLRAEIRSQPIEARAARSAARATKQSKKNRKVVNLRRLGQKTRDARNIPWWADAYVEIWKSGKKSMRYVTRRQIPKFKTVPNRGVARMAWIGAGSRFAKRIERVSPKARKYARTHVISSGGNITQITMENRIYYMPWVAPKSAAVGVQKTTNWINSYALKQYERKLKRTWSVR